MVVHLGSCRWLNFEYTSCCYYKKSRPPTDNAPSKQHKSERTSIRSEKKHKGIVDDVRIIRNTFHGVQDRANDKSLLFCGALAAHYDRGLRT